MNTTANLSKEITLDINGSKYTVKFPKTADFININSIKARVANNNYNDLAASNDEHSQYARLLADMIATFTLLIPELKKNMNVEAISDLDMIQSKELLDVYTEQWLPFYNNWMSVLTAPKAKAEA